MRQYLAVESASGLMLPSTALNTENTCADVVKISLESYFPESSKRRLGLQDGFASWTG